jgi:hypothetical protein
VSGLAALLVAATALAAPACADAAGPMMPPDPVSVPIDPAGHYALTSSLSLASVPPPAVHVLSELASATDGPDDPSRYLIDLMIDRMPEGGWKTSALALAPYFAAYMNNHLAQVAPRFAPGARALAAGLERIAQHVGTIETLDVTNDGELTGDTNRGDASRDDASRGDASRSEAIVSASLRRTLVGLRFDVDGRDVADVRFAPLGLPDIATKAHATLAGDRFTIDRHALALPYTRLLRLGFDFAVIPSVVPGAHDLGQALEDLVNCDALGVLASDWMGIGSPEFYASACRIGLTALAAKIYSELETIDPASLSLALDGVADAVDADHDGPMDAIDRGLWTGDFAGVAVTGSFDGDRK